MTTTSHDPREFGDRTRQFLQEQEDFWRRWREFYDPHYDHVQKAVKDLQHAYDMAESAYQEAIRLSKKALKDANGPLSSQYVAAVWSSLSDEEKDEADRALDTGRAANRAVYQEAIKSAEAAYQETIDTANAEFERTVGVSYRDLSRFLGWD